MPPGKRAAILSNPLSEDSSDPVRILAMQGNVVIGRQDVVVGKIRIGGNDLRCLWGSDLLVPEQFRSSIAGLHLVLKLQGLHHTVGTCGVSQVAHSLLSRLGWTTISMPRYVLMRSSRPLVDRFLRGGVVKTISQTTLDRVLRAQGGIVSAWTGREMERLRYERVDAMTPDLEPHLASNGTAISSHRSTAWINWLLEHSFYERLPVQAGLYYIQDSHGEVLGYFLAKSTTYPSHRGFENVRVASLKDWLSFDRERLDRRGVIACAIHALLQWDVEVIEVCVSSSSERAALRKWGFVRRGDLHLLLKGSRHSPLSRSEVSAGGVELSPAEGDNFFS